MVMAIQRTVSLVSENYSFESGRMNGMRQLAVNANLTVDHLSTSFLYLGVSETTTSLWEVPHPVQNEQGQMPKDKTKPVAINMNPGDLPRYEVTLNQNDGLVFEYGHNPREAEESICPLGGS